MVMKKHSKKNIIGNETWFMGIMLNPRCNCRGGSGKGALDQKHDDLTKIKLIIDVFFD